jgi:cell division protein FtsW (lipid II flippase)
MDDDDLKKAWQSQATAPPLTLDADLLLNEVRRNERQFTAMIFCRDLREIGVAVVLLPIWTIMGIKMSSPWTWWLGMPALLWLAGFMIIDRRRQRRNRSTPGDNLRRTVECSVAQVEHQIWLLRNIAWWYLLPIFTALMAFAAQGAWQSRDDGWKTVGEFAGVTATFLAVFGFIYWLNQYAVRKQLEPRRKELQTLLSSLDQATEE